MHGISGSQIGQIHRNEFRQVFGQTGNIQLGEHMADDTPGKLYPRRDLRIDEVQGHFHVYLFPGIDPLKIDMQHLQLERVHLNVAQQYLLFLAFHIHGQDGGMEGFQLELVIKIVMIQLDGLCRILSAINDSRHLPRTTQAAARTFALQCALLALISICIIFSKIWIVRDQTIRLIKPVLL